MTMTKTLAGLAMTVALLSVAGCMREADAPAASPVPAASPSVALEPMQTALDGIPEGGNCSLDTINQQPVAVVTLRAGAPATFVGWVGDTQGEVPSDVRLVLAGAGGTYSAPVQTGLDRPDVAAALGQPGLATSGLIASTVLDIAPGSYRVSVVSGTPAALHCQFDVELELGEAESQSGMAGSR